MALNERKQKILKAVIDDYIQFAEPVGSSHIAKKHDLSLSSATIRNELADLEALGYLIKTHTSSGRVPSELGYRTYVDSLMEKYRVQLSEINHLKIQMQQKIKELDFYIKKVLEIASSHNNLTAMAITPDFKKGVIKKVELMMLDGSNILVILVTDSSIVKSKHIHLNLNIDINFVQELKEELNRCVAGITMEEISYKNFEGITEKLRGDHGVVTSILEFVYATINEISENEVYVSGEANMLSLPEFKDVGRARDFLELVHDKPKIKDIFIPNLKDDLLNVLIGDEIKVSDVSGLSLVLSTYKITDSVYGAIGVIGPTRMDYQKAVSSLDYITKTLNEGFKEERNET